MKFQSKLKFSGILATFFFAWFYGALVTLPIVDGQFETANNHCGGVFRHFVGTINLIINNDVLSGNEVNMVCVWTIIPTQMHSDFIITINEIVMNTDDHLSFSTFTENEGRQVAATTTRTTPGTFRLDGNILIITLVSPTPKFNNHFRLAWSKSDDSERVTTIRYVTTYNSYGKDSVEPLPYFAWGFLGNSLSTFAFPKGNDTEGFIFEMIFQKLELESKYCSQAAGLQCDMLMLCGISETGTMAKIITYDNTTDAANIPPFIQKYGLFMIMWGGNYANASGGGSFQLTYSSIGTRLPL